MSDIGVENEQFDRPVQIVPYADHYKDQIKGLILGILKDEQGFEGELPDLDRIPEVYKGRENFWLAVEGEKLVGTIGVRDAGKDRALMKRLYVDKNFRGTGVADKLYDAFLQFVKENSYKQMYLTTTKELAASHRFYEKKGFKRIEALPPDIPDLGDDVFYAMDVPS